MHHDVNPNITTENAEDLLDYTIAILDFTYTFKIKFENFINRKNKNTEENLSAP